MGKRNTIFGEEHFIDTEMIKLVKQRNEAIDNFMFKQMENVIRCSISVEMPEVIIDKEKLRRWVVLCMKLENIEHSELIDMATKKKIGDLKNQLALTEKALELACEMVCGVSVWGKEEFDLAVKETCDYFKNKAKEMMKSE